MRSSLLSHLRTAWRLGLPALLLAGLLLGPPAARGQTAPAAATVAAEAAPRWDARPLLPPLTAAQSAYWQELLTRAEAARLWEQRFWHLLLHYRPDRLAAGRTSEADGPGFFLAPDGKSNPRAELAATLAGFFSAATIPPADLTPQCTFPARLRWLDAQLGLDPARLPRQPCERLERWLGRVDADSASLIFSSYFFNNPASMFGHTLLRFNRKGRSSDTALLDFALNYAATVDVGDNDLAYMVKGLFGGYRGYFSLLPYYLKVREYNDLENRDLWEYRLNLAPERVAYMLLHTWELGSTYFDYYFFDENCSYHLLSLIEIGNPRLHLREAYGPWTLPTDTVQQVVAQPGLVRDVLYRPSQSSQMAQKLATMTPAEQDWTRRLVDDPALADTAPFAALPRARAALALDAAIDLYQYRLAGRPEGERAAKARLRALLLRRSRIPLTEAPPQAYPPRTLPPHKGHDSARTELALGASRPAVPGPDGKRRDAPFAEVAVQAAFHDLLSDDRAVAPNSHINLLHLRARYGPEVQGQTVQGPAVQGAEADVRALRLERFAVFDIQSLFPLSQVSSLPSWKLLMGWQRNRDTGCGQCTPFVLHPAVGYATQTGLIGREVYFALLDAGYEYARAFDDGHRAGFGLSAGVVLTLREGWRLALTGTRMRYTEGQRGSVGEAALQQRFTLSRNLELSLEWRGVQHYREGKLGLGLYF